MLLGNVSGCFISLFFRLLRKKYPIVKHFVALYTPSLLTSQPFELVHSLNIFLHGETN